MSSRRFDPLDHAAPATMFRRVGAAGEKFFLRGMLVLFYICSIKVGVPVCKTTSKIASPTPASPSGRVRPRSAVFSTLGARRSKRPTSLARKTALEPVDAGRRARNWPRIRRSGSAPPIVRRKWRPNPLKTLNLRPDMASCRPYTSTTSACTCGFLPQTALTELRTPRSMALDMASGSRRLPRGRLSKVSKMAEIDHLVEARAHRACVRGGRRSSRPGRPPSRPCGVSAMRDRNDAGEGEFAGAARRSPGRAGRRISPSFRRLPRADLADRRRARRARKAHEVAVEGAQHLRHALRPGEVRRARSGAAARRGPGLRSSAVSQAYIFASSARRGWPETCTRRVAVGDDLDAPSCAKALIDACRPPSRCRGWCARRR